MQPFIECENYNPNTGEYTALIIRSPFGKRFAIEIDEQGILTTVEITEE